MNLASYWPFNLPDSKQQIIQMEASQNPNVWFGLTHRYTKDNGGLKLEDYGANGWIDAWKLKLVNGEVIEWADEFPTYTSVFATGKELWWGGNLEIGQEVTRSLEIASGVASPYKWGTEVLKLEALHNTFTIPAGSFSNVVQVKMFQSFCKTNACTWPDGQNTWITRHWLASNVGIIQTEYLSVPGTPVFNPPRIDYATNIVITWKT